MTSADLFAAAIASSIAGSIAICAVFALRGVARRRFGAQAAYLLWTCVPLAVLATLVPAPVAPVAMFVRLSAQATSSATVMPARAVATSATPLLLAVWGIGAFVMACMFVHQQRRYVRGLGRLSKGSGAERDTFVAEATSGCPALIGALRPRIVLPRDFESRYVPEERTLIIAHERAHWARGDAQANAMLVLARCLNWFNPLVHVASALFRLDQELACDAAVIRRFPEARRSYAGAMLKTQLSEQSRQELRLPVGCHWPLRHPLKERIHMLKHPVPTRARRALGTFIAAALALGAAYVSWSAQPARAAVADRPAASEVTFRSAVPPRYPATAIAARVTGDVIVTVHVNPHGEPESAEVTSINPPGASLLGDAAIAAVMKWRFNPATENGVAVASSVEVPLTFSISGDEATGAESAASSEARSAATPVRIGYRKLTPPAYPPSSVSSGVEGIVYVDATLNADGSVAAASVDHVEPPIAAVLGHVAAEAVRQWQFDVPLRDGRPVQRHAVVPVGFAVNDPDTVTPTEMPPDALETVYVVAHPADTTLATD